MNLTGWLGVALVIALAVWRIDAVSNDRDAQALRADSFETQLAESALRVTEQSKIIQAQAVAMQDAAQSSRLFQSLTQTIQRDGQATRQTLAEIKANDKAVADYLLGAVPAVYGVQFARPATYDPAAYRPGAVPAGGLPAARAAGDPVKQPVGTGPAEH